MFDGVQAGGHGRHESDITADVGALLQRARSVLRDDPQSARSCLLRAVSLLDDGVRGRPASGGRPRGGLAAWQLRRIDAHIDANIGSAIRTSALAAAVQLSPSHFSRAFRQSLGDTPSAYVARRRMKLVQEKMLTTDAPLSQIALDCGLCDQSHLTRVFRRFVGTSPRRWRRQHWSGPAAGRTLQAENRRA